MASENEQFYVDMASGTIDPKALTSKAPNAPLPLSTGSQISSNHTEGYASQQGSSAAQTNLTGQEQGSRSRNVQHKHQGSLVRRNTVAQQIQPSTQHENRQNWNFEHGDFSSVSNSFVQQNQHSPLQRNQQGRPSHQGSFVQQGILPQPHFFPQQGLLPQQSSLQQQGGFTQQGLFMQQGHFAQQGFFMQQGHFVQQGRLMSQNPTMNRASNYGGELNDRHAQFNHHHQTRPGAIQDQPGLQGAYNTDTAIPNVAIEQSPDHASSSPTSQPAPAPSKMHTVADMDSKRQIENLPNQVHLFDSKEEAQEAFWQTRRKHVNVPEGQSVNVDEISSNRDYYINLTYKAMLAFDDLPADPKIRKKREDAEVALIQLVKDMIDAQSSADVHEYMSAASATFVDNLIKQYEDGDRFWKTSKSVKDRKLNAVERMEACLSGLRSEPRVVIDVLSSFDKMVEFIAEPFRQTAMKGSNGKVNEQKKLILAAGKAALTRSTPQQIQDVLEPETVVAPDLGAEEVSPTPVTAVTKNRKRKVQDNQDSEESLNFGNSAQPRQKVAKTRSQLRARSNPSNPTSKSPAQQPLKKATSSFATSSGIFDPPPSSRPSSVHQSDIEKSDGRYYNIKRITGERPGQFCVAWEDSEEGQKYEEEWISKDNVNEEAVDEWEEAKRAKMSRSMKRPKRSSRTDA